MVTAAANKTQVVGRFAPTPSGRMHLGNVFAALMAWLGARSAGGQMVLRIEDLDTRAQNPQVADDLMRDLEWLGLDWDQGPFYQSQRQDLYCQAIEDLTERGLTYPCFCSRADLHAAQAPHASDGTYIYQGTCRNLTVDQVAEKSAARPAAARLVVPAAADPTGTVTFVDQVFGRRREVLAHDCGDFIVRRSDGVFAYQLAVVVDDGLMGVNQVVRGMDLLGSCARQTYLARLLGFEAPTYAHVPLLVAPDGRRLAKREKDLALGALRAAGVSAQQICGLLAGVAGLIEPGQSVMPRDLIEAFSWDALAAHRGNIVVDGDFLSTLVGD